MSKQTAVEWFFQQIYSRQFNQTTYMMTERQLLKIFLQAKEMEKEQIEDAYCSDRFPCSEEDGEQYFNETYREPNKLTNDNTN
jgi:hypothetical protein